MNIVISGYYGYGNFGDELILRALLTELKSKTPKSNIIVLSGNPKETKILHKVGAVHRYNPFAVIKAILGTKILVSGGGGLLQDRTSKRSILYYLSIILLAKVFCKKVIIYAQGIGPISSRFNILFVKFVIKKVDEITVRDKESRDLLMNVIGINKKIDVVPDPVCRMDLSNMVKKDQYASDVVGIVVRDADDDRYKEIIANIADKLITEKKLKVVFVPFQKVPDLRISNDIIKHMKSGCEVFNASDTYLWLDEIVQKIASLKLLIGMRLHSIILASKLKVPFVAISYDKKVESFLKSIGHNRFINIDEIKFDDLYEEVSFALND